MKAIFNRPRLLPLLILVLLLLPLTSLADGPLDSASFQWLPSSDDMGTNSGYNLYIQGRDEYKAHKIDVGTNTTVTITNAFAPHNRQTVYTKSYRVTLAGKVEDRYHSSNVVPFDPPGPTNEIVTLPMNLFRLVGATVSLTPTQLLANSTNSSHQPLRILSVQNPSDKGVPVLNSGNVFYLPSSSNTNSDTFRYQVTDGISTNTGTVNVLVQPPLNAASPEIKFDIQASSGTLRILDAMPGAILQIQRKENLSDPNWTTIGVVTATDGTAIFQDDKISSSAHSAYYRTVKP